MLQKNSISRWEQHKLDLVALAWLSLQRNLLTFSCLFNSRFNSIYFPSPQAIYGMWWMTSSALLPWKIHCDQLWKNRFFLKCNCINKIHTEICNLGNSQERKKKKISSSLIKDQIRVLLTLCSLFLCKHIDKVKPFTWGLEKYFCWLSGKLLLFFLVPLNASPRITYL